MLKDSEDHKSLKLLILDGDRRKHARNIIIQVTDASNVGIDVTTIIKGKV